MVVYKETVMVLLMVWMADSELSYSDGSICDGTDGDKMIHTDEDNSIIYVSIRNMI